jgi:general stress protein 26
MLARPVKIGSFAEIQEEFIARAHDAIWCVVTSISPANRPKSRLLHPIWDGQIGWVATFRDSPKAKHFERNPYVSVTYCKEPFKPVYADCIAEWADDLPQKQFAWNLFMNTPPPLGYPMDIPPDDPKFGVLKLIPWRIEVYTLGGDTKIWRSENA